MNGSTFRNLDRSLKATIPDHTCPDIDSAIDTLEELRKKNSQLREAAEYWKDACDSVCDERDELDSKLDDALSQISDLEKELGAKS